MKAATLYSTWEIWYRFIFPEVFAIRFTWLALVQELFYGRICGPILFCIIPFMKKKEQNLFQNYTKQMLNHATENPNGHADHALRCRVRATNQKKHLNFTPCTGRRWTSHRTIPRPGAQDYNRQKHLYKTIHTNRQKSLRKSLAMPLASSTIK